MMTIAMIMARHMIMMMMMTLLTVMCAKGSQETEGICIMPIVLSRSRIFPPRLASFGHCVIGLHVKQPQLCTLPPSHS